MSSSFDGKVLLGLELNVRYVAPFHSWELVDASDYARWTQKNIEVPLDGMLGKHSECLYPFNDLVRTVITDPGHIARIAQDNRVSLVLLECLADAERENAENST